VEGGRGWQQWSFLLSIMEMDEKMGQALKWYIIAFQIILLNNLQLNALCG
jgi:hypothetical protein